MKRRRRGAVPEAKTQGVGWGGCQASRAEGTAPRRRTSHRSPEPIRAGWSRVALAVGLALAGRGRAREPPLFGRLPPRRRGAPVGNRLPRDTALSLLGSTFDYDAGGFRV